MTYAELKTMAEDLLDGLTISDTLFGQLLNMEKDKLEGSRPWMVLRAVDGSKTFTSADGYDSTKALPERFLRPYPVTRKGGIKTALILKRDSADIIYPRQIPFAQREEYENDSGLWYLDMLNEEFGVIDDLAGTYTAYLSFLRKSEDIDSDTEWAFPSEYHPILAFNVAIRYKGEVDFDEIHARMVAFHGVNVNELKRAMTMWDAQLQTAEQTV